MLRTRAAAALTLTAASLSVPASAGADDWYRPAQRETRERPAVPIVDARTPDAVDAGRAASPTGETIRIVEIPAEGFAVTDAAIGGAATLAVVVLVAAGGMTLVRRRSFASLSAARRSPR